MKIHVTLLLVLLSSSYVLAQKKPLYVTWYDDKDRLYAQPLGPKESIIYFFPYLIDKPYVDSMANLYHNEDLANLYHQQNPPNLARKIDPAELIPVTTKAMPNKYVFFIDLRTMTPAEQDSCQSFMQYFYDHLEEGEQVLFYRMGKDNAVHNSLIYPQPYYPYAFPRLDDKDTVLWHSAFGQMGRLSYTGMFKTMSGVIERNSGGYHRMSLGSYLQEIVIYIGKTGDFGVRKEELLQVNTKYRTVHDYMHYIDLSEGATDSTFRQTAKIGGGAAMKMKWGKETLTQTIMNDLVVYYLWEEEKTEEPYPSQAETYPTPKTPQPAKSPLPLPSKRPVILEPVKKPRPAGR